MASGLTTREMGAYTSGHISNVENGHVTPSLELVKLYADFDDEGPSHLIGAYKRMKEASGGRHTGNLSSAGDEPPVTPDSSYEEIHSMYELRECEAIYLFDARGIISEVTVMKKVKAAKPDLRYVTAVHGYNADERRGVMSIEEVSGVRVRKVTESDRGFLYVVLELEEVANPDDAEQRSFCYRLHVNTDVPTKRMLRFLASPRCDRYAMRVQFTPPALPAQVWWFRESDAMATELALPDDKLLPSSSQGFYFREFFELNNEYCGLAWSSM